MFVANAKKFGTFCAANPSISIVNAAEKNRRLIDLHHLRWFI
jgi:hypothetical protein